MNRYDQGWIDTTREDRRHYVLDGARQMLVIPFKLLPSVWALLVITTMLRIPNRSLFWDEKPVLSVSSPSTLLPTLHLGVRGLDIELRSSEQKQLETSLQRRMSGGGGLSFILRSTLRHGSHQKQFELWWLIPEFLGVNNWSAPWGLRFSAIQSSLILPLAHVVLPSC